MTRQILDLTLSGDINSIKPFCDLHRSAFYSVNEHNNYDIKVCVRGDLGLSGMNIPDFIEATGVSLSSVEGTMYMNRCKLETMRGFPKHVHGNLILNDNELTSLEGLPGFAGGISIALNKITSLKGMPKLINGEFHVGHNPLDSLEGGPISVAADYVASETTITTLDFVASHIAGTLRVPNNRIFSLLGIHKKILSCEVMILNGNPIIIGGIGLLLIDRLERIETSNCVHFNAPAQIINKYLGKGKAGLLACASELEEAGYGQFARL